MKIVICGNLRFIEDMKKIKEELESKGHKVILPIKVERTNYEVKTPEENAENVKKYNLIKKHYGEILNSDAILVLNKTRDGIIDCVGGNSFLEMGFAYVNNKKIFLLNDIPKQLIYYEEMLAMCPVVLNSDLNKLK